MHRIRRILPTLLLAAVATAPVAACSRAPKAGEEAPAPNAPATLRVQNRAFADMVIYLVSESGARQRLGMVTGNSTGRFTLPSTATSFGNVRFLADPIGSNRAPISEQINVRPGDEVVLEIPPQ
jgi:hypothetical protein